jgi:hypothetical protein
MFPVILPSSVTYPGRYLQRGISASPCPVARIVPVAEVTCSVFPVEVNAASVEEERLSGPFTGVGAQLPFHDLALDISKVW